MGVSTTKLSLAVTPAPTPIGSGITLTATVDAFNPTQPVQFTQDGTALGAPVALSGGKATTTAPAFSVPGGHSYTATIAPDTNNTAATGLAVANVAANTTTATISASATKGTPTTKFSFTATIAGGTPTGTVTFRDNGAALGMGTITGGSAPLNNVSFATGQHAITATYGGDTSDGPSGSQAVIVMISANGQTDPTPRATSPTSRTRTRPTRTTTTTAWLATPR